MLLKLFRFVRETAVSPAGKRSLAVIACAAGLAGCGNLSDMKSGLRETFNKTFMSPDNSAANDHVVADGAAGSVTPDVRAIQARLARLGFRPGPADGVFGSQTAGAIKRYQAAHRLPVTGTISSQFLKHLEATSAVGSASAGSATNLGSDDFPAYLPGTSFIYSDGNTERVLSARDGVVRWARGDGTTYTADRNFLLPKAYWASDEERGTAKVSGESDALWPTHEGAEVSFSAKITMQRGDDPSSITQRVDQWRCRNDGRQDITVQAGTFETLVLFCRREGTADAPAIERTWYYAEGVRHYVRFVENNPEENTTTSADLVAVRPGAPRWPPIVRAALTRALVHALEMAGSSSRMPWTSSGVNTQVTIEANARFVADDGRPCRRFVQIWSENGLSRHYPAVACKSAAGKWTIPSLEGDTADSLATAGGLS